MQQWVSKNKLCINKEKLAFAIFTKMTNFQDVTPNLNKRLLSAPIPSNYWKSFLTTILQFNLYIPRSTILQIIFGLLCTQESSETVQLFYSKTTILCLLSKSSNIRHYSLRALSWLSTSFYFTEMGNKNLSGN